jgi:hypothetical protein
VDALTRVDIACRHLGTKRAVKRPPQSPREGRPGRAKKCPPTARAGERVPASRRSRVREYTGSRRQRLLAPPTQPQAAARGRSGPADPRGAYLFQSGSAPLLCTLHRGLYTSVAELTTSIGKGFSEVDFVWQNPLDMRNCIQPNFLLGACRAQPSRGCPFTFRAWEGCLGVGRGI